MGDNAFSLPTLLLIVPIAGALVSMTMLTRRAAAIASGLTFLAQAALLVVAAVQLDRFSDRFGGGELPGCDQSAASDGATFVLAQCNDWFPQWGIGFDVSLGWGAFGLVCLTTFVTALASAFTVWADRDRAAVMHGLMWFAAAALTGLFLARDLVLFYVFFELMLVPMLLLVGVWGGERRVRATMTMFVYTLVGSLPMLVGVVGAGMQTADAIARGGSQLRDASQFSLTTMAQLVSSGDLRFSSWILASFLLAFIIKAPLIPFHGWLPLAYREAPAEVTAMLSGLVSKAAYFGLLVLVLPLFPEQLAGGWGTALTWLAVASLVYGCFAAFRQRDPRGVVAYSSLAQMGLIVLGLSTFLSEGGAMGVGGAYLQTINHGLISAGLFLLIGIVELRSGERTFAGLGGLATGRPRLLSLALVLTLITLAVPGATTFAGELLILGGVFRLDDVGPLVATIGAATVVLAAMYALRLVAGAFMNDGSRVVPADAGSHDAAVQDDRFGLDLRAPELLIVVPVVLVLLAMSAWPNVAHRAMDQPPIAITVPKDTAGDGITHDEDAHGDTAGDSEEHG